MQNGTSRQQPEAGTNVNLDTFNTQHSMAISECICPVQALLQWLWLIFIQQQKLWFWSPRKTTAWS